MKHEKVKTDYSQKCACSLRLISVQSSASQSEEFVCFFCRLSMSFLLKPSQKKVWTSGSFAQICHPLAQERDRFGRPITDGNSLHRPLCRTPQIVTVHSLDGGNTHTHTWIHKVQVKGKNKNKTTSKIKHQSHRTVAREIG